MTDKELLKEKINTDEDFILYPKMTNSLAKLLLRYPDGVEDSAIMKALMMTKEEFDATYEAALAHFRKGMGIDPR